MKYYFIPFLFISYIFCSCSRNDSSETHYAEKDYSMGTGLETYDSQLATSIDNSNRHNPFKTQMGFTLRKIEMEDEAITYILDIDEDFTNIDWDEFDKIQKQNTFEFLGEHSDRVKFFSQCAYSGRYIIMDFYENDQIVHSIKIWPGDFLEE